MATLHVRNVPDDLYERLRARAKSEGRSLSAEAIDLLREALGGERKSMKEFLDAIDRIRWRRAPGMPTTTELIREDRDR